MVANFFLRLKTRRRVNRHGLRQVETACGTVRVLEYGFEDSAPQPLYVDMHGGGFILMHAEADEVMNLYLREKTGVKIISIDYPKAPEHPFPVPPEAVCETVRFYVAHAAEWGIDARRIGIGGHSAGANLATAVCMMAKERGDLSFRFQLLDYPPLDLATDAYLKPLPKGCVSPRMATLFNACYVVDPRQAEDPRVSPVFATPEQLGGLPPALLIVAGRDSLHDEGVRYAEMLRQAGVSVVLHDFPNAAHGFTYYPSTDTDKAMILMAEFIRNHTENSAIQ
ncbi:MAG: alpha/beta hydrolase [Tannerella sp.]|jgi:acetyl esterase|nr:alpha/beta hydrolase [Tannerella sp.]